ncbi:MAG: phosphomannomutase/phosphoglucomutase [Nanobdellota archaeon]
MTIYKSYDIRGKYPEKLNEEKIYKIGQAYASILKEELQKDPITIAVAKDMRLSSPSLSKKIIEGIISQGVDVIDLGMISTPTFYFGVSKNNFDGGMMVSASHNPKEYNGVKIVKTKAYPVSYDTGIDKIKELVERNRFEEFEKGKIETKEGTIEEQVDFALKFKDFSNIKPLKVVIDTANSMGAQYFNELLKNIPCELIKLNFELDGTFPAHEADPLKKENLEQLKKSVLQNKADLGIASDGDGDRVFFIDDKGKSVEQSIIRGLISKEVLKDNPGAKICYDIRPGKVTKDMIEESGGIPVLTKVGHSLIKKKAIEEGSPFAGESSGHFFVKTDYGFFETPCIITLILLKEISENNEPFSEMIKPYKKYFHSGEINSSVDDKQATMEKIKEKYHDAEINLLDGVTIEYPDYWFNVRPSNTESKLRLNLEAKSKELMEEKRDEVLKTIRND